jgi:hypothetical protein
MLDQLRASVALPADLKAGLDAARQNLEGVVGNRREEACDAKHGEHDPWSTRAELSALKRNIKRRMKKVLVGYYSPSGNYPS